MRLGLFEVHNNGVSEILLAVIHGTRTVDRVNTNRSMKIGSHDSEGATVALHTLCIHPDHQARGLGSKILKEYLGRVRKEKGVQHVALSAHNRLVPFYEPYETICSLSNFSVGFVNEGISETEYTGATWYDSVYTYKK